MLSPTQLSNLKIACQEAVSSEKSTGVPAPLTVAQWALESGWGSKTEQNNCFGIKAYPGCYGTQLLTTHEWFTDQQAAAFRQAHPDRLCVEDPQAGTSLSGSKRYKIQDLFATFPTLADCFSKRAEVLASYGKALTQYKMDGDFPKLVNAISTHYSTDPKYASIILSIASMPEVVSAIGDSRQPIT